MIFLRQSTASQEIPLGRFVDSTDGNTEKTGLTIANTDIKIWKSGATTLSNKNSGGATHIANGEYYCVLDATDTDTIGPLKVTVHVSGALYVQAFCTVLDEAVYDALFGTTALATATNITAGTITTATNVTTLNGIAANVITASALAADAVTEIRDAITGGAYALSTDANGRIRIVDGTGAGELDTSSGLVTLTAASIADINATVDTALADIRLDELLAADSDIDGAAPPTVGSVFHELMSKTAGSFTFDQTTDSLEAIRDRGDAAWLTATGFSTHSAADVWSVATRVLTAATNISGPIADQVWEETLADHSGTVGSTAEALNAAGAAGDPWTTALPGAYGAGSAGYIIGNYLTGNAYTRLGAPAGASIAADIAAVKADTAAILLDTGTDGVVVNAAGLATDAVQEIRNAITGGAYALSTDANGRVRIVDGTGAGELNTTSGVAEVRLASGVTHGGDETTLRLHSSLPSTPVMHIENVGSATSAIAVRLSGGLGKGLYVSGGSPVVELGGQLKIVTSGNDSAVVLTANGSGSGILSQGGATGHGARFNGGATNGHGILMSATADSSHGLYGSASGTGGSGGLFSGTGTSGRGLNLSSASAGSYGLLVNNSAGPGALMSGTTYGAMLSGTTSDLVLVNSSSATLETVIRSAVGLAAANLDTQLTAIDDYLDTEIATIISRIGVPASSIAADIAALNDITAADVWAAATRTLTAGTNIALAKGVGVTGFNDLSAAQVKAEVVDALSTDTYAEPSQGAPGATLSLAAKIAWIYASWRNKKTNDGSVTNLYADDGTTILAKQNVSEAGGTVTKAEWITGA